MTDATVSQTLAAFASGLEPRHIPPEVLANARLRLLDTVGVCLASVGMAYADAVLGFVQDQGGRPHSRLFARDERAPAALAALYNASLAHGNDYDDTHSRSIVHAGAVMVPTALAVGEQSQASPADTLAAIVAGYEVATRIGMASSKGFHEQGFHSTSVCGTFGAAAVSARLMGLDSTQTAHALGIAGSQAAGSLEFLGDGAWTKRLHPGWAAHSGVTAAALAARGFTGPRGVLDGRYSLYALYATAKAPDLELAVSGLGSEWEIVNTDFKPYPCGHISHPYMDCALELRRKHKLRPQDIASIEVRVPGTVVPILCEPAADKRRPSDGYAARFSLPFSLALIFAHGRAEIDDFSPERLAEPVVRELSDRMRYTIDDTLPFPQTFPGWVIVTLTDGRRLEERLDASRGSREYPMSEADLRAKFEANASQVLPAHRVRDLWDAGQQFDTLPNVRQFTDLLGP